MLKKIIRKKSNKKLNCPIILFWITMFHNSSTEMKKNMKLENIYRDIKKYYLISL